MSLIMAEKYSNSEVWHFQSIKIARRRKKQDELGENASAGRLLIRKLMDKIHLVVTAKTEFQYRGNSRKTTVRTSIRKRILVKGTVERYSNVEHC